MQYQQQRSAVQGMLLSVVVYHTYQCCNSTYNKYTCGYVVYGLHLDSFANPLSQLHCQSSAYQVAEACAGHDHQSVVRSRQDDDCDLGAISPFGQESHGKCLPENDFVGDVGKHTGNSKAIVVFTILLLLQQQIIHICQLLFCLFQLSFLLRTVIGFVEKFKAKVKKYTSYYQISPQLADQRWQNSSESSRQYTHHCQRSKGSCQHHVLLIFHGHDHGQKEGFIADLQDLDGQERCEERGGEIVSVRY